MARLDNVCKNKSSYLYKKMKESTENTYTQKYNHIMDYINSNLHNRIELNSIAKRVNTSKRQLLRITSLYLNEPLYNYIRRLRLERAILYMQTEKMNLIKLADMSGYETPQSFSKAFKKYFKVSPKRYLQKRNSLLKKHTKTSVYNNIAQEEIFIEKINLIYIRIIGKYGNDEGWDRLTEFLKKHDLLEESTRFFGISFDDPNTTQAKQCHFYACASINNSFVSEGEFGTISIDQGKYLVYTLVGGYSQLQNLYNNILLDTKCNLRHGVAFEEYINDPKDTKEENLITKIFIPIK